MRKFILMAAVGLMLAFGANAQKQGYVNVSELMASLPQVQKAQKDMESYSKSFQDAYTTMVKDYQTKLEAYQAGAKTMSDAIREAKESELSSLQKRIGEYEDNSTKKIQAKQDELMKPIYESVNKNISDYAAANGYDYVFSVEALLYAKDSDNLTKAIMTKMGGKAAVATGTPNR